MYTLKTKRSALALSQDTVNRSIAMPKAAVGASGPDTGRSGLPQTTPLPGGSPSRPAALPTQTVDLAVSDLNDLQGLMKQADTKTEAKDYQAALAIYTQILSWIEQSEHLDAFEYAHILGLTYTNQAWLFQHLGELEKAEGLYSQALDLMKSLSDYQSAKVRSTLMMIYSQRGMIRKSLGRPAEALGDLKCSVDYQAQLVTPEDPLDMVRDWLSLAQLQNQLEHPDRALVSLDGALRILFKLSPAEQAQLILPVLAERAQAQQKSGQLAAAMATYSQVLLQIDAQQQPLQWAHYALLDVALHFEIDTEQALSAGQHLHLQLQQLEAQVAERHALAYPLLALAGLCEEAQDWDLALAYYNLVIRALERSQRKNDFVEQTLEGYEGRARCLQQQEQTLKAIQAYRRADKLAAASDCLSEKRPLILSQMGLCYQEGHKYDLALSSFTQAIQLASVPFVQAKSSTANTLNPEHPLIRSLYLRGFLNALYLDQSAAAITDFEQIEQLLPGFAAYDLACLSLKQGDLERAFTYLRVHLASAYALSAAEIQSDPDLAPLLASPQWQVLFA